MAGGTLLSLWQKKGVNVAAGGAKEGAEQCNQPPPAETAAVAAEAQEQPPAGSPTGQLLEASPPSRPGREGAGEEAGQIPPSARPADTSGNSASKVYLSPLGQLATPSIGRQAPQQPPQQQKQVRRELLPPTPCSPHFNECTELAFS